MGSHQKGLHKGDIALKNCVEPNLTNTFWLELIGPAGVHCGTLM